MKKLTDEELAQRIERMKARCSELMSTLSTTDAALVQLLVDQAERECAKRGHDWHVWDDEHRTCRRCGRESKEHMGNWEERRSSLAGIGHLRIEGMAWRRWLKQHGGNEKS